MDAPGREEGAALAGEATRLLERLSAGDRAAAEALLPLVDRELRAAAERAMRLERADHTLQPTALVNEAWLRLVGAAAPQRWEDRTHFLRLAARAMRNVLVDHAREKRAAKRGGAAAARSFDVVLATFEERSLDVVEVHDALEELGRVDAGLAQLVELRFFGGLTIEETAAALESSTATVERDWRVARMWMRRALGEG